MNKCDLSLKNLIKFITYIVMVALLASCAAYQSLPPTGAIPSSDVWQYTLKLGDEYPGYATYSYVLVGRDRSNPRSSLLYYELIDKIKSATANASEQREMSEKSILNIFLIPIKFNNTSSKYIPNYELSKSLLTAISTNSSIRFTRPGPYIITMYKPIGHGDDEEIADILYLDLTDAHPDAIPEIVRTYREKVIDSRLDGIEKLKSLRLSLLNIALHFEDSIGFAKSAYASMRKAFDEQ